MATLVWKPANSTSTRSVYATGAVDDTLGLVTGSTEGLNLDSVSGFAVYAVADTGRTITTAVNATAYTQDPTTGLWGRAENYDITGQTVTGVQQAQIGSFSVDGPVGRIAYKNNGGAVSAGSLTLRIVACGFKGDLL